MTIHQVVNFWDVMRFFLVKWLLKYLIRHQRWLLWVLTQDLLLRSSRQCWLCRCHLEDFQIRRLLSLWSEWQGYGAVHQHSCIQRFSSSERHRARCWIPVSLVCRAVTSCLRWAAEGHSNHAHLRRGSRHGEWILSDREPLDRVLHSSLFWADAFL